MPVGFSSIWGMTRSALSIALSHRYDWWRYFVLEIRLEFQHTGTALVLCSRKNILVRTRRPSLALVFIALCMLSCLSLCLPTLVLFRNGWMDRTGFRHRGYPWPLYLLQRIRVPPKIRTHTSIWNFHRSSELSQFFAAERQKCCCLCLAVTSLSQWVSVFVCNTVAVVQSNSWHCLCSFCIIAYFSSLVYVSAYVVLDSVSSVSRCWVVAFN